MMNTQVTRTSEIWSQTNLRTPDFFVKAHRFPVSLQFCKSCGSLDVFITKKQDGFQITCLDCHDSWMDDFDRKYPKVS